MMHGTFTCEYCGKQTDDIKTDFDVVLCPDCFEDAIARVIQRCEETFNERKPNSNDYAKR